MSFSQLLVAPTIFVIPWVVAARPGSPPHCHTATSLCVSPGLHVAFLRGHLSLGLGTTMLQVTDDIAKTSFLNKVPL